VKVSRGDVVLLDFPFSDATGSKVRPAIVVQSDSLNQRLHSTLVVLVTKTTHRAGQVASQFTIEADTPSGKSAGLHFDSAVSCNNLYTVHKDFINYRIGRLTQELLPTLDGCLRAALGLQ
jgi:mRNA interferase MazF